MALEFPSNPTNGQVFDDYFWDASIGAWRGIGSPNNLGTQLGAVVARQYNPNYIINGAFEISQRGIGTTPVRRTATEYGLDRWLSWQFQAGRFSQQVVTGTGPTSRLCMRVGSSTTALDAGTRMRVGQKVESINTYPLRGKTVTFSFYIRFSNATFTSSTATPYGNFAAEIGYYTSSTDSNFGTSTSDTSTIMTLTNGSLPTTWTKYTVTGTVPANANNLHVGWTFLDLGSTSANDALWYEVTDVQLEEGSTPTPFRRNANSIQGELAACQRYFVRYEGGGTAPRIANGFQAQTNSSWFSLPLPVTMRRPPVNADLGWSSIFVTDNAVFDQAVTSASITVNQGATDKTVTIACGHSSVGAQFRPVHLMLGTTGSLAISTEL